jgi:asparagine synthase (glutamine-hydrolysing)
MSGVFGVISNKDHPRILDLLTTTGEKMAHRSWYQVDTFYDEEAGVGLGRIGIGIFNPERQPICSEDRNLMVFLSGELYGTRELRRDLKADGYHFRDDSDSELILRLFQEKGKQVVHDLEGMFVLAIWNRSQQEVIIANDRFGLYPLLYAHYNGKFVFAPEMKWILCDPEFHKELDLTALAEYMRFQHLLGDKTFFTGLKLLPNASLLSYNVQTDCLTVQPYWDFSHIPQLPATLTFSDSVEEAGRLLKAAVDKLTEGDHRLGVYLSGGVDSRVILGLMNRDISPITTITFGQRGCRDVVYAQAIAAKMSTKHHYYEFTNGEWVKDFADFHLELTEGFHSWIHAHGISILDQVRPLIDVNLTGFGGAAIDWEDLALLQAPDDLAFLNHLFHILNQKTTWPSLDDIEERLLFSPRLSSLMRGLAFDSLRTELAKYDHLPYEQRAACFARFNPARRLFQYYTVFHRSHFEIRFPFCDYRYNDFVYALPSEMLSERRLRRAIILNRLRPLARIPYDKDNLPITEHEVSRIKAKLVQRSKSFVNRYVAPVFPEYSTLYADYENWLRNELRDWGENILLGERTLRRDIFNPEFLRSLWLRHQSGLEVHTIGKIAPLMTYEMMLREFYDK